MWYFKFYSGLKASSVCTGLAAGYNLFNHFVLPDIAPEPVLY
jgi:hypothetical protein